MTCWWVGALPVRGSNLAQRPVPACAHPPLSFVGHYAYFDASVLGPGGSKALLVSEHLPATTGACLQFWYHMDFLVHFCKWCQVP